MDWDAETIKRKREGRGWTQKQLAEALTATVSDGQVALRTVGAWEAGTNIPQGRNIAALDRVLGDPEPGTGTYTLDEALPRHSDVALVGEVLRRMALARTARVELPPEALRLPSAAAPPNLTAHHAADEPLDA